MQHVMLYCFKKGDSTNDITDEIYTVYGNDATITIIHNWFKRFRDGNFNSKDENRSSCPATTKMDFIKAILAENPRYSVQEIVNAINISRKTVDNHLTKMEYVNRCKVWISQLLTKTNFMNQLMTLYIFMCDFLF